MKYRVIYRQSALKEWQAREFSTSQSAYAFKRQIRAKLWAATVQWLDAQGQWNG